MSVSQARMLDDITADSEEQSAESSADGKEEAKSSAGTDGSSPATSPTTTTPPGSDNKRPQPTRSSTFSVQVSYLQHLWSEFYCLVLHNISHLSLNYRVLKVFLRPSIFQFLSVLYHSIFLSRAPHSLGFIMHDALPSALYHSSQVTICLCDLLFE